MSDSLRPHELQHTRPPCPSPTPRVHSNSCPSSQRCHPAVSNSVVPFSPSASQHQSSNESALRIRWPNIGVSASTSVLPMSTQDWFPLEWTGWISLQSKGLSRCFPTPQFKSINSSVLSFLYSPTLTSIHDYWKTIALTRQTFVDKVMSLLFNMLSRFVKYINNKS